MTDKHLHATNHPPPRISHLAVDIVLATIIVVLMLICSYLGGQIQVWRTQAITNQLDFELLQKALVKADMELSDLRLSYNVLLENNDTLSNDLFRNAEQKKRKGGH